MQVLPHASKCQRSGLVSRPSCVFSVVLALCLCGRYSHGGVIFSNVFSFAGTNGDSPIGTLVQGKDGNLYGVTQMGGAYNTGTVFRMSLDGTFTMLASFDGTNGAAPHAGLVQGTDGNFYGTASSGGQYRDQHGYPCGTVFHLTEAGVLTSLASFNETNGAMPAAELVQGADGDFYGTTQSGGQYHDLYGWGCGTVYKVTTSGVLTTLVSFNYTTGGGYSPWGPWTQGRGGSFYGTTRSGGSGGYGTLFQVTPPGMITTVMSFDGTNGSGSFFGLVRGANGDLYGASEAGGHYRCGTVYRMAADGQMTTLVSFNGTNGAYLRGITQASDGNIYGIAARGGVGYTGKIDSGCGTIFQVTPGGTLTSLVMFTSDDWPFGGLLQANDGNLYGVTRRGGDHGHGRIFRLSFPMPPVLRGIVRSGDTTTLTWSAVAGQRYQVQYRTNLYEPGWTDLGSPVTATSGTAVAGDAFNGNTCRFYRMVLLP